MSLVIKTKWNKQRDEQGKVTLYGYLVRISYLLGCIVFVIVIAVAILEN
jgi:hypothetical protein